jgi:hypothetical protein
VPTDVDFAFLQDVLARAVAFWLVVLVVLPFSAPFSTCDLATFAGTPAARHADGSGGKARVADSATSHVLPIGRIAGRLRLLAAAQLHSRVFGLLHEFPVSGPPLVILISAAAVPSPALRI